jgi:hypothetical protein
MAETENEQECLFSPSSPAAEWDQDIARRGLLLPLPNRRVFLRSTCDRTQRHCTGEIQSNYEINKPVMKVESGFLSFVRKLESANVNSPDGDL